jgi:hypothetical protein
VRAMSNVTGTPSSWLKRPANSSRLGDGKSFATANRCRCESGKPGSRPNTPRHWQARLRSGTSCRVSRKNWLSPIARTNLFPCCFERKLSFAVAWFLNALLRPGHDDENGHAPRMVLDGYDPGDRNSCRRPRSFLTAEPRAHTVRAASRACRPSALPRPLAPVFPRRTATHPADSRHA